MKERCEKFRPEWNSNPVSCDACAMFYQLSYQANWELVITWVYDIPVGSVSIDEISFELEMKTIIFHNITGKIINIEIVLLQSYNL